MTIRRLTFVATITALWAASVSPTYALRIPEEESARRVLVYSFWNRDYLCLGARVPDTIVTGTSNLPMSTPEQDDAIEFDFSLPAQAGGTAHRLIISAAQGMTLLTRDARGNWRSDSSWVRGARTIRCMVSVNGTLNNPNDTDVEFVVECAIPWQFLGGMPSADRELGFNVVNWMQGDNQGVASWSRYVTSAEEAGDAARWGQMLVTRASPLAAAQGLAALSPFSRVDPMVDGVLSAQEWMTASSLSFDKPEPELQPSTSPPGDATFGALMAIYRYDWDATTLWQEDGDTATVDQPKQAAGPWYDYRRVDWHRDQLDEVKRSGIDIILVHYRGDEHSRRTWARAGLDRLTQALKEMRAEGKSYPLVGLFLDTTPLQGVDLRTDQGKRLLYVMVRDFYRHVPREFRADLAAKQANGIAGGVPVMLGDPAQLADWDGGFMPYLEERLGPIAWLGSAAWREKGAERFHAFVRLSRSGLSQEGASGVAASSISPGFCPPPGSSGEVSPRRDGRAYRTDWQRLLAASPELVVINSWNDFANGTEIAPSRQYGFSYVDATRVAKAQLGSRQAHSLRLLQNNVPKVLKPGVDYLVEFVVENSGTEDIETGRTITADYRIARRGDGAVVQEKIAAQEVKVLAGQIRRMPVVIATEDSQGRALPAGEYLFSLVVVKTRLPLLRSKLVAREVAELTVPITLGAPPLRRATVISTSLPSSMESGATEAVVVRLRNDGASTWRAAEVGVTYHWVKHDDDLAPDELKIVASEGRPTPLPKNVPPGEVVSVPVPVRAVDEDGAPLEPSRATDLWHYRVQWDVVDQSGPFSVADVPLSDEAVQIVSFDQGAVVESVSAPLVIEADGSTGISVTVGNAGRRAWKAEETAITCDWHRWDGRPVAHLAASVPLDKDLAPGEKVTATVPLRAPSVAGPYWLVSRIAGSEVTDSGRRQDLRVTPILVHGGYLRVLDLSSLVNVVAITNDSYRARGDLDGQGRSLPAEALPPDLAGATEGLYPTGYYRPLANSDLPVPFAYPAASTGVAGAVACDGQTIELGAAGVDGIHLLAASTSGPQQLQVTLRGLDGRAQQVSLQVPSWIEGAAGVPIGASTPYLRALDRDDAAVQAYLYHLTIATDCRPVSMELPRNPAIKILAVTVESQPVLPATEGS